jgi:aryl-alcohol dehydrogenase-like predicted oxidoreductase
MASAGNVLSRSNTMFGDTTTTRSAMRMSSREQQHLLPEELRSYTGGIGLGTWQLGGQSTLGGRANGWGELLEPEALRIVRAAVTEGIRFFDTADIYGHGLSETRLGKSFSPSEKYEVLICSKCGNVEDANGAVGKDFSPRHIITSVEGSLRRLRRYYIDILLLHSPPDDYSYEESAREALSKLVDQGKIRAYGVSARSVVGGVASCRANFGSFVEAILNPMDRRACNDLLPLCIKDQRSFIARVPLASGFLTPRGSSGGYVFSANDYRSNLPQNELNWRISAAKRLAFLNDLPGGISVSALRYSISQQGVTVAIPGARNVAQVKDAVYARELGPLPLEIIQKIEEAVPEIFEGWRV